MKLYRTTVTDAGPEDVAVRWAGSQAEAASQRKALNQNFKRDKINTEEVDVPTDKKGLLEFLNKGG